MASEPTSLRSGISFKQKLIGFAATVGTLLTGGVQASQAHIGSTVRASETPLVKALEETAGQATQSGEQLLAHYYPYRHHHQQTNWHYRQHPQNGYYRRYPQQYRQPTHPQQYRPPVHHPQPTYYPQHRGY
jgi:hypothetical protein